MNRNQQTIGTRELIETTLASNLHPRHKREILVAITRTNLSAIAADAGMTRQAVSKSLRGTGRSERIEQALAAAVGVDVERLFPEFYGPRDVTDGPHDEA